MKAARKRPVSSQKRPQPASASSSRQAFRPDILAYIVLVAAVLLVVAVRLRLRSVPLERDEGEYALMGQLILQGIPPYEMAYNMKLPGTYYAYALLMTLFGQTPEGIRLGLLLVHLVSMGLLFGIGRKIGGAMPGAVAAATYGLLCLVPATLGLMAHATHFNVLFALAGLWLLLHCLESPRWVLLISSGLCFGLSFLAKQQGVFFPLLGALLLGWSAWRQSPRAHWRIGLTRLAVFGLAALLPYGLFVLSTLAKGTFERFWHWTVEYASQYAGTKTLERAWTNLSTNLTNITKGVVPLWVLGLIGGLSALWVAPSLRRWGVPVLLFTGLSLLCVLPGFYFRSHYFIAFFPALALLVGLAVRGWTEWIGTRQVPSMSVLPVGLFLVCSVYAVRYHRNIFFRESPEMVCYRLYGRSNPFVESVEISKFLRSRAKPGDRLAVVGSEPQLYFYSRLQPATGFIYTYPLMENQPYSDAMQQEMAEEIERNRPRFLVYVSLPLSWLRREESSSYIFDWYRKYAYNYRIVQAIELPPGERTKYHQAEALNNYKPQHPNFIFVHERVEGQ